MKVFLKRNAADEIAPRAKRGEKAVGFDHAKTTIWFSSIQDFL